MFLFFPPVGTVAELAGAPKGAAAKLKRLVGLASAPNGDFFACTRPAKELEIDPRISDKTIKKALRSRRHTLGTSKKLSKLESPIEQCFGIKIFDITVPDEVLRTGLCWWEWRELADLIDNGRAADFLPRTTHYFRKLALWEKKTAEEIESCKPDYEQGLVRLIDNQFVKMLCPEISPKTILRDVPPLRTLEDVVCFRDRSRLFKEWLIHCRVSLLMDLLAHADIEYCKMHILPKGSTTQELRSTSPVVGILPTTRGNKLVLPISLLFERWFELSKLPSWRQFAKNIPGNTELNEKSKILRRWRNGSHIPSEYSIQGFLANWLKREDERDLGLLRFRIARFLTKLYQSLQKALPDTDDEQRVQMFWSFHRHRKRHLR
jgi:hypothetical protein